MSITVPEAAADMLRLARDSGVGPDDDIGRLLVSVAKLATALDTKPVADIERLVRQTLGTLGPEYKALWRWKRLAWVIGSAVCTAAVVAALAALVAYHIGRDLGAADSARWSAWCSERTHIVVQSGGSFCQIPVSSPAH